jgi:hypothetical protein
MLNYNLSKYVNLEKSVKKSVDHDACDYGTLLLQII